MNPKNSINLWIEVLSDRRVKDKIIGKKFCVTFISSNKTKKQKKIQFDKRNYSLITHFIHFWSKIIWTFSDRKRWNSKFFGSKTLKAEIFRIANVGNWNFSDRKRWKLKFFGSQTLETEIFNLFDKQNKICVEAERCRKANICKRMFADW